MFLHAYLYVKIEKVAPILDNYWVIQPIWTFYAFISMPNIDTSRSICPPLMQKSVLRAVVALMDRELDL